MVWLFESVRVSYGNIRKSEDTGGINKARGALRSHEGVEINLITLSRTIYCATSALGCSCDLPFSLLLALSPLQNLDLKAVLID